MSKICGIELKASEAILAVLEGAGGNFLFVDTQPRKIQIGNDECTQDLQYFFDSMRNFIRDNHITVIAIKKRNKKGSMSGGAVSFKLEALIQINGIADVQLISAQSIASQNRKDPFILPESLNKYQENAFMSASTLIRKNLS